MVCATGFPLPFKGWSVVLKAQEFRRLLFPLC